MFGYGVTGPHPAKSEKIAAKIKGNFFMLDSCLKKLYFRMQNPHAFMIQSIDTNKKPRPYRPWFFVSSGGRTRTCDLRVMSPTSCHCSTPQRSPQNIPDLELRVKSSAQKQSGRGS